MKIRKEVVKTIYRLNDRELPEILEMLLKHLKLDIEITTKSDLGDMWHREERSLKLIPKS